MGRCRWSTCWCRASARCASRTGCRRRAPGWPRCPIMCSRASDPRAETPGHAQLRPALDRAAFKLTRDRRISGAMTRSLISLFLLVLSMAAQAQTPQAVVENDNTTVRIYSEVASVAPGEPFWLGVELDPSSGWHTYWRNPGDSGMTNALAWTLPDGVTAAPPLYPVPARLPLGPLMNYGYKGAATLLVRVTPPDDLGQRVAGDRLPVVLAADWLVCADICVPESARLSFSLPLGDGAADPAAAERFAAARAALPGASPWTARAVSDGERLRLDVTTGTAALATVTEAYFFPRDAMLIDHAAGQAVSAGEDGFSLTVPLAAGVEPEGPVRGLLKVWPPDGAVRGYALTAALEQGPVAAPAGTPSAQAADVGDQGAGDQGAGASTAGGAGAPGADLGVLTALAFALVGGVLLNLMPCVFPVLSLKALAMVQGGQRGARHRRVEGAAYTVGVLASMLALAGVLLALKAAGQSVGWGFQLQNPWIILGLILVLFAVGLNLAGLVSVGGRFAGVGQGLTQRSGPVGAFFTGVLATVVATPCTAPFMAVALGFALTQTAGVALAVFAALGLGLALPILAISTIPPLAAVLPRPGAWMEVFKQALAFPVFLTVVWLVWVLGIQTGADGVAAALAAMVLLAFMVWMVRVWGGSAAWRGVGVALALVGTVAWVMAAPVTLASRPVAGRAATAGAVAQQPFSQDRLEALRAAGEPVFVYFTAAWCITCQVNERVALAAPRVERFLAERDIHVLVGDWTSRDDRIGRVLRRYGRSGVPLYLFFTGPGEPVILPQILTPEGVMDDISAALAAADATASGRRAGAASSMR
ncbi:hypothetical protein CCR85_10440 [Rhodothalassium salexigens]|nr:hypothetical protein [Rhodothalassium salexigens]MBK5921145.1 hypothetical protein [Rhodothalassium salexigens]